MPLCELCAALRCVNWQDPSNFLLDHHRSYAALRSSAQSGCSLCALLQEGFLHCRSHKDEYLLTYLPQADGNRQQRPAAEIEACVREVEKEYLAKPQPFYLQRVHSTVNGTGGTHGFEYCVGTFDPNPPMVQVVEITAGFTVTTGPDLAASGFLRRRQGPRHDLNLAASWLSECQTEHFFECRGEWDPQPPTRLLRVSQREDDLFVALIDSETDGLPYIALSHCWGQGVPPLRTLTTNHADHTMGIRVSSLPKTFRDAVTVAQHLGVEHLWIDSLCIIQDSAEDWERECPRMSSIYSNAVLTIAAHDAPNSAVGFLADYPQPPFSPVEISIKGISHNGEELESTAVVEYAPKGFYNSSKWQSILSTRGWVLQERVLSPRILSFHTNRLMWECNTHVRADDRHRPVQIEPGRVGAVEKRNLFAFRPSDSGDSPNMTEMLQYWDHIVTVYSACQLMYGTDRLPALSGIAQRFAACMEVDRYVAGLWESDLHYGLAWYSERHSRSMTRHCSAPVRAAPLLRPDSTAPSWSWASTECAVSFYQAPYVRKHLAIEAVVIEPRGMDPFGQIKVGSIRAAGRLSRIVIPDGQEDRWTMRFSGLDDHTEVLGEFYPDCPRASKFTSGSGQQVNQGDGQREIYALLLTLGGFNARRQLSSWTDLALERVELDDSESLGGEMVRTFRRIGLFRYSLDHGSPTHSSTASSQGSQRHDRDHGSQNTATSSGGSDAGGGVDCDDDSDGIVERPLSPHSTESDQGSGFVHYGYDYRDDGDSSGEISEDIGVENEELPPLPDLFAGCEKEFVIIV
ncbi:heterokaryon incompatibility protein-domain-containing protein [Echria macrotheca]|uniref:Heterokaryon incompatibility protein-domain-containing protein n=1 Tax=Echria macrotheca TaxID=438768 RepID=A0AAJ0B0P2_9PEZI|nr:heterokaryon incompatibility protein-domain-containing protein [Echria macrotheca]